MAIKLIIRATFFIIAINLTGCYSISDPDLWPTDFVQKDQLPGLVGLQEDEVIERIGPPTYVEYGMFYTYYLYQRLEDDSYVGMVSYIPFWVWRGIEASCVLLTIDGNRVLVKYAIDWEGSVTGYAWAQESTYCKDLFPARVNEYQLWFSTADGQKWIASICTAAEQGDPEAQFLVGTLLEGKYFEGIRSNTIRAYVWYRLSELNGFDNGGVRAESLLKVMTDEQVSKAKQQIIEWNIGQCKLEVILEDALD